MVIGDRWRVKPETEPEPETEPGIKTFFGQDLQDVQDKAHAPKSLHSAGPS